MKIKGAIFDMDGTLLDSMSIWFGVVTTEYLKRKGIKHDDGESDKFKAMTIWQTAEYYREHYGIAETVHEIVAECNRMMEYNYSNVINAKSHVVEALTALKERGVKMCIATATDRYLVEAALKHNGIYGFFSDIFTTAEVGSGKESPVMFEMALEALGTRRSETWVFEDALYSIKTAKRSGFKVVGIFDEYSEQDTTEIKRLSDIYSYEELLKQLKEA